MSLFSLIKQSKNSLLFLLLLIVLPFLASSFIVVATVKYESQLYLFSPLQWVFVYLGFTICMGLALTHTTFVALFGGFFLGWISAIYLFPAYVLSSLIGFFTALQIDKGNLLDALRKMPGVNNLIQGIYKNESVVIFFCRLSPVLPFAMMNALLALLHVNRYKFVVAGSLGMLPRSLLFLWLGMQAKDITEIYRNPKENTASQIMFVGLLIVSIAGLLFILKKVTNNAKSQLEK